MSIRISVGDKWVITSDQYQFILQEKKIAKTGKMVGKEWLDTIGYYPKISQLVSGLLHHHVQTSAVESIGALTAEIERIGQDCEIAFNANAK